MARKVVLKVAFDHLLWAVPDLDDGAALFNRLTGTMPVTGGTHPGFGTRNALTGLSDSAYFEVLAPDPAQELAGRMGERIAALSKPQVLTFALSCGDLDGVAAAARAVGVVCEQPIAMSRTTPEGVRLDWSIMRLSDDRWPDRMPFFIDWQESPHPARTTPGGCSLDSLTALAPDPGALAEVFDAIRCPVPVTGGAAFGFIAELTTPYGKVVLT